MLKFSSRESNIQRVLKQYGDYAVATHGAVGGLVETGVLPPLPSLPDENSEVLQGLSAAQRNAVISKLLEDRVKQHRQREDALPKMFAEMNMFTPPEGLHVIEERAEYAAINAARDPIGMRRLLLETFTLPGMTDNEAKRKTIVERHYHMCYQRHGQDEKSFYDRLKLAADAMAQLGETYAIPEVDQARHYIMRLQPQYAQMVTTMLNDMRRTLLPKTLAEAYTKTVAWVKAGGGRVRAPMDDKRVPTGLRHIM